MIRDAAGVIRYLTLDQLVPYDQKKGRIVQSQSSRVGNQRRGSTTSRCPH